MLQTLAAARAAGLVTETIVVHRPEDDAIRALAIEHRCLPAALRNPEGTLSDSLRAGVAAIEARGSRRERGAILVCLGDQPLLRLDVIRALVETWKASPVPALRPSYRADPGRPGHPILIDRSLWHLAGELRGEYGFGTLFDIRHLPVRTVSVAGRNPDVDTPEDLLALDRTDEPVPERSGP